VGYERGEFAKVSDQSVRLRESLLKGDSWSELFFQLARICILSTYFSKGLLAAQHELELFHADYVRRHAGRATTVDVLLAMIWRLEWNPDESVQALEALNDVDIHSAIGKILETEQRFWLTGSEPIEKPTPRSKIVANLQRAQSSRGRARRDALERALQLAFKEGQIAPFLEHRDALLGMSSQIKLLPSVRRNPMFLRMVNVVLKSVEQSYVVPKSLRKIGINRRQYRVAVALQSGAKNKKIARQLGITEATVKYHLTSLYRLTGVSKRSEFIDFMNKN
jgi:DNA-binding CsgD family transcriptional regulator